MMHKNYGNQRENVIRGNQQEYQGGVWQDYALTMPELSRNWHIYAIVVRKGKTYESI